MIRPSVRLTIPRMSHDREELQKVYDIGRRDAKKRLTEMKNWLEG